MNKDEEVMQYTGDLPFASIETARDFILAYDHYDLYGMGRLTVELKESMAYLGWCGLKYHENTAEVDLGFRLNKWAWGKGFATEAAIACLDWAFNKLALKSVIARTMQENEASKRVLEKLGFQYVDSFEEEGAEWLKYQLSNNLLSKA